MNGGWSEWSDWSDCSRRCGSGFKRRTRLCNNPTPVNGQTCVGENVERINCTNPCAGMHFKVTHHNYTKTSKLHTKYSKYSRYLLCPLVLQIIISNHKETLSHTLLEKAIREVIIFWLKCTWNAPHFDTFFKVATYCVDMRPSKTVSLSSDCRTIYVKFFASLHSNIDTTLFLLPVKLFTPKFFEKHGGSVFWTCKLKL